MDDHSESQIAYDVRDHWERDRSVRVRELALADIPGLERTRDAAPISTLVDHASLQRFLEADAVGWALESRDALFGVVGATLSTRSFTRAPHPWSEIEADALEETTMQNLVLECAWWAPRPGVSGPELLRDTACNTVQRLSCGQVRVDCPVTVKDRPIRDWLMTLHAAFEQSRWDDNAIAVCLRAGFELQGWYAADSGRAFARLSWNNRAR